MDLNSVNIFVMVVLSGSFSGASKKSGIPVATISRRVSELENVLGVRLLERSTRHLRPTGAGNVFFEQAQHGLDQLQQARLALQERERDLVGTLRLSLPPNFEPWWKIIRKFQQQYINIKVDILITERKIGLIEEGIDVVLRVGEALHQSAIVRELGVFRHRLVASPQFIKTYGEPKTPEALLSLPCAAWNSYKPPLTWCLGSEALVIEPVLQVNDFAQLKYHVLQGVCISEFPPFLVDKEIQSGDLVPLLSDYPLPKQSLSLLFPSRQNVSRIVRTYIDFCLIEARDMLDG